VWNYAMSSIFTWSSRPAPVPVATADTLPPTPATLLRR
jgi:hypothetical protein